MSKLTIRRGRGLAQTGVGVLLMKNNCQLLAGNVREAQRAGWMFPETVCAADEPPRMAALRALREEVGLDPSEAHLWQELDTTWLKLPKDLRPAGVTSFSQTWLVYRFTSRRALHEITPRTDTFGERIWIQPRAVVEQGPAYLRPIYASVAAMLQGLLMPGALAA